jgi:alkanesulfonate monooxygenase SsuD/methylene tetrahydromethanopterin reductase-like flavin-dependent oxidoreductase (luciferase family)
MDLFEDNLVRIEDRLGRLVPSPVRRIPILIGGMGVKRTLPIVAKHADIWHTFATVSEYRRKNAILKDLVAEAGRDETRIERAVHWTGRENADEFLTEGVTLFTTENPPDRRWLRLRRAEGHAGLARPAALTKCVLSGARLR